MWQKFESWINNFVSWSLSKHARLPSTKYTGIRYQQNLLHSLYSFAWPNIIYSELKKKLPDLEQGKHISQHQHHEHGRTTCIQSVFKLDITDAGKVWWCMNIYVSDASFSLFFTGSTARCCHSLFEQTSAMYIMLFICSSTFCLSSICG